MSEEKLDKIDRRLTELVNITGNLVTTVRELSVQVGKNTEQIKKNTKQLEQHTKTLEQHTKTLEQHTKTLEQHTKTLEQHSDRIGSLESQQKTFSGQLADIAHVVIKNDQRLETMNARMEEGFEEIRGEMRIYTRKIDWATNSSLDAQKRVEDLETRVSKIEDKVFS